MDFDLLKIIEDRKNYIRFKPYIKEHLLSREAAIVASMVDAYYTANPSETQINWDNFETHFLISKGAKI